VWRPALPFPAAGVAQPPIKVGHIPYTVRQFTDETTGEPRFSLVSPAGVAWLVGPAPEEWGVQDLCATRGDKFLAANDPDYPLGFVVSDDDVLWAVERGTIDWYVQENKVRARLGGLQYAVPEPFQAGAPHPECVLEVAASVEGVNELVRELDARLAATPPVVVGTRYGDVAFTVVPPDHTESVDTHYIGDTLFGVAVSGELTVSRTLVTLAGTPDDDERSLSYSGDGLSVLTADGTRTAPAASRCPATAAVRQAWESAVTLPLRHLLDARTAARHVWVTVAMRQGADAHPLPDYHPAQVQQLHRELLRVTADSLEGPERQAAQQVADAFPGTSQELIGAVRALLAGPSH